MHYEDIEDKSIINFTVYKHLSVYVQSTTTNSLAYKYEYELCSIQSCSYIKPKYLQLFLQQSNRIFKSLLKDIPDEKYWSISFNLKDDCFKSKSRRKGRLKFKGNLQPFILESREAFSLSEEGLH